MVLAPPPEGSQKRPHGIPTTYHGTRFRSRLEARWAAFFDLIGWSWVYEPFDLDGWIPDFAIEGAFPFLVEVGPCLIEQDYIEKGTKARLAMPPKMELRHGIYLQVPQHWTLVAGASARFAGPNWNAEAAGYWAISGLGELEEPAWWKRCTDCGLITLDTPDLGGFARPCGHAAELFPPAGLGRIVNDQWSAAGNQVQWRKR